jgi:hypothetical protein
VEILEGEHKGLKGWVESNLVHMKNPMAELQEKSKVRSMEPKIAVNLDGDYLKITNADNFDWGKCGLALNDWDYSAEANFKAGETVTVPLGSFKKTLGDTRFDSKKTKPFNFNLTCKIGQDTFLEWRQTWSENIKYPNKYPTKIPKGFSHTIMGKYRFIEYNEEKTHVLFYDANKIEKKPDGDVTIFPPAYVQEYNAGKWHEETYNETFSPIYSISRNAIIENPNPPKNVHYPERRRVKK